MKTLKIPLEEYQVLISNIKELEKAKLKNGYIDYKHISFDDTRSTERMLYDDNIYSSFIHISYSTKTLYKYVSQNEVIKKLEIANDSLYEELESIGNIVSGIKEEKNRARKELYDIKRMSVKEFKKYKKSR